MRRLLILCLAGLAGCHPAPAAKEAATAAAPVPAGTILSIQSKDGRKDFTVEMAVTDAEQDQGLMFRKTLEAKSGMLFPFDPPRPPSFWMKNTVIPLDMIFIGLDGKIAEIHENEQPYTLEPVSSGNAMIAVLEIAGGTAAASGLAVGDSVRWGKCPGGILPMAFCGAPNT